MSTRLAFVAVVGFAVAALAQDHSDDRALIEKAAAERAAKTAPVAGQAARANAQAAHPGPAAPADARGRAADDLARLEEAARADVALAQARLELVLARKLLRDGDAAGAGRKAQRVLALLKQVPANVDISVYELQAEGVLARARRAGVEIMGSSQDADAPPAAEAPGMVTFQAVRNGDGESIGGTARIRGGARIGYSPGRPMIDVDDVVARDEARLQYEGALREAVKADEARRLTAGEEARLAGENVVTYPGNWPEIVAKRERYKDGVVARSRSWTDDQGREWYIAIYDIRDLTYVPPDFANIEGIGLLPRESLLSSLQIDALLRSDVFRYYAAGGGYGDVIQLLRYFGGAVDPFEHRGPRYSVERQQEIIRLIKAFVGPRATEPMVEGLGP